MCSLAKHEKAVLAACSCPGKVFLCGREATRGDIFFKLKKRGHIGLDLSVGQAVEW